MRKTKKKIEYKQEERRESDDGGKLERAKQRNESF